MNTDPSFATDKDFDTTKDYTEVPLAKGELAKAARQARENVEASDRNYGGRRSIRDPELMGKLKLFGLGSAAAAVVIGGIASGHGNSIENDSDFTNHVPEEGSVSVPASTEAPATSITFNPDTNTAFIDQARLAGKEVAWSTVDVTEGTDTIQPTEQYPNGR